ncbi:Two-component response regulator ARR12 [Platanthera guangdongensis]|uniref:Two-component response regulator n=1 Tax=Platanthera guangdongensis TaxID=2320717 RepID=A0ABR2LXF2_9ASPA
MAVDEKWGGMARDDVHGDQFPIGMRVLAVDDDPICLRVLETLLLRCQYHVTTTNQAMKALNMLRENKDKFDLVISDVHMPDMDGYKLLELVGLEMDLPVIMLSANGETKAVMKGITHGACDYLLKPLRIEELKNIWQHVVRRRRFDQKDRHSVDNGEDYDKSQAGNSEGLQGAGVNGTSDHNGKVNRKRKDQNDEDDDYYEENTHESEDPSSQKKARVVWSVDLHRKFVAAVNQLGVDKAVPKRILDLMNVDKLTRENVASHLQKYRLYLKRLSAVASQQANIAAALGGRDNSYLHMASFNGFGNFQSLSSSGQLQGFTQFQPSGISSRTNPNLLGLPGLAHGTLQISHTQNNANNPMNNLHKFQHINFPANQHESLLQGIPTSLELDQLQNKHKRVHEQNNRLPGVFSGTSNNSFLITANHSLALPGQQLQTHMRGLGNQSSIPIPPSIGVDHPDLSRCNEAWEHAPSLSGFNTSTLSMDSSNIVGNLSSTAPQLNRSALNISANNLLGTAQDTLMRRDMQGQTSSVSGNPSIMPSGIDADPKFLNFRSFSNLKQKLDDPKQQSTVEPNFILSSSLNSSLPNQSLLDSVTDSQRHNRVFHNKLEISTLSQPSFDTSFLSHHTRMDKSVVDNRTSFNDENMLGTSRMQDGFVSGNCNFDELMNAIIKPERDDLIFGDGELGSDLFPLSTCM